MFVAGEGEVLLFLEFDGGVGFTLSEVLHPFLGVSQSLLLYLDG